MKPIYETIEVDGHTVTVEKMDDMKKIWVRVNDVDLAFYPNDDVEGAIEYAHKQVVNALARSDKYA